MPRNKPDKDLFKNTEAEFSKAMGGWSKLVSLQLNSQGQPELGPVVDTMASFLQRLVSKLFDSLRRVFATLDPFGAAGQLGALISDAVDGLLGMVNQLIEDLLNAPGALADSAIGAVLGLIEAVKKAFYLILDGIKLPDLTRPVEIFLDLINNILGNIAEVLSPATGKTARRFRNDMYGQLYAVRRADAARAGRFVMDEGREED